MLAVLLEGQRADGRLNGIFQPAFQILRNRLAFDRDRKALRLVCARLEQFILHFRSSGAVYVLPLTLTALPAQIKLSAAAPIAALKDRAFSVVTPSACHCFSPLQACAAGSTAYSPRAMLQPCRSPGSMCFGCDAVRAVVRTTCRIRRIDRVPVSQP